MKHLTIKARIMLLCALLLVPHAAAEMLDLSMLEDAPAAEVWEDAVFEKTYDIDDYGFKFRNYDTALLNDPNWLDLPMRYQPYSRLYRRLLSLFLR